MTPDEAMAIALAQGRRALGRTWPNPSVGAVVFRRSGVLGVGRTQPPGGPHAEIVALAAARRRHGARALAGASVAVTLEPCCFTGRTGPCTEALLDARVRRVFVGARDPHPRVRGRGLGRLRRGGLEVTTGLCEEECRELHRGFFSVWGSGRGTQRRPGQGSGRPFVTLKLATSLDGRIATATGESRWITSAEARRFVHGLRARVDAVAVGSGTARADDPALTARRGSRIVHRPVRVLVDSRLQVPLGSRLFSPAGDSTSKARGSVAAARGSGTWVLTRAGARGARARRERGARLFEVRARGRHLDLGAGLRALAQAGLTTLLVEGGGGLAAALLRAGLVDEIHWIQAPLLLGGDGRPALGTLDLDRLADAPRLQVVARRRLGPDLHWHLRVRAR